MPIALVPASASETLPVKRGRGRPPGSKNKSRVVPVEPEYVANPTTTEPEPGVEHTPAEPALVAQPATQPGPIEPVSEPVAPPAPSPPSESAESPEEPAAPVPKPRKKLTVLTKPRAKRVVREPSPPPPDTPRTVNRRARVEHREQQVNAHIQRREYFSNILERFMS